MCEQGDRDGDDIMLTEDEAAELIIEVEKVINAIKNRDIEGKYLEF